MQRILLRLYQRIVGPPALAQATMPLLPANTFPEEPLSVSGDHGFGFFPARPGLLLNNGRYEILRKVGRGQFSSTWLVSDSRYVCKDHYPAHSPLTSLIALPEPKKHQGTTLSKY
jgi:serine/threonine-protein kinase SRPK3